MHVKDFYFKWPSQSIKIKVYLRLLFLAFYAILILSTILFFMVNYPSITIPLSHQALQLLQFENKDILYNQLGSTEPYKPSEAIIINLHLQHIRYIFIYSMNFITKIPRSTLTHFLRATFSSDNWKDRDQSAEKVFITQEEKRTLSKLLNKIDESDNNSTEKELAFQRELKNILKKHKITSEAFEAEVNNLHKYL